MRNHTRKASWRVLSLGLVIMMLLPGLALAAAPDLTGIWQGSIDIAGTELGIEVELAEGEAGLSGSLSIPAQGANDLPFTEVELNGNHLVMAIDLPGGAGFEGTIADDGTIAGTFTQAGQGFPFSLHRYIHQPPVIDLGLESLQGLDDDISQAMREWKLPGLAVAIVQDGEIVYAKGFGLRDVAGKLPVTTETAFGIGSTTKAFTTAVLGMLVDEGELNWDTAVKEYIPGFELQDPLASGRVTLRDLATHRIGLPRNDFAIMYNPELTREGIVETMDTLAPNADFRTTWQYNNLGYVVAAYAAEQATGQSWEQLVTERLLTPLGMSDTTLTVEDLQASGDHALAYIQGKTLSETEMWELGASAPAGSINSSVMDMSEWLKFQLNEGKVGEQQLLSSLQLQAMHTPQMAMPSATTGPVQFSSYGLGWMIESYRGHYLVHHGGNVIGHTAEVALFPEENSGIVVLGNLQGTPVPSLIMYNVADRLYGLEPLDLSSQMQQQIAAANAAAGTTTSSAKAPALTAAQMQEYVGEYEHPFYGTVKVSVVKGKLQASYYETTIELTHQNHDVLNGQVSIWPSPIPFQFERSLSGSIEQVKIGFEPASLPLTFTRQAPALVLDPAVAAKVAGQYNVQGTPVSVKLADGKLNMTIPGQPAYELQPVGGLKFAMRGVAGYSVEFVLDSAGKVTGIIFHQPNGVFEGKRVSS